MRGGVKAGEIRGRTGAGAIPEAFAFALILSRRVVLTSFLPFLESCRDLSKWHQQPTIASIVTATAATTATTAT